MHFIGHVVVSVNSILESYRNICYSNGTCTYTYTCTHIFARANMRYLFFLVISIWCYANCLALAILTLEVSHDRSSILQR